MEPNYTLAIKDEYGHSISGVRKKVNDGTAIDLNMFDFRVTYSNNTDFPPNSNKRMTTTTRFKDRLPNVGYGGLNSSTIEARCVIDMNQSFVSGAHIVNSETFTYLTFPLLFDLVTIPNVYYLRDYVGASATYRPPIDELINHTDFFDQTGWGSNNNVYTASGMPVFITGATVSRDGRGDLGHLMNISLFMKEVNPD